MNKSKMLAFVAIFSCMTVLAQAADNNLPVNKEYNLLNYGAKPDGSTLNTKAIQTAIDDVSKSGDGKLTVPAGRFLTGRIELKSNVELYLDEQAVILGSTNPYDYYTGNTAGIARHLINGNNISNVSITGKGVIDGQGRQLGLNIDSLYYVGKLDKQFFDFTCERAKESVRPKIIAIDGSKHILLKDITTKNSTCFVQLYYDCEDVVIENITVNSVAYHNNDGIDFSNCRNVHISDCIVNTVDDGICLKGTYNENILIENCRIRSSASAIKFGSGSGAKNVTIRNIDVYDTFRSALAIESVDGNLMEDILVDGLYVKNAWNIIFLRLGDRTRNSEGGYGTLKNITIRNVKAQVPFIRPDLYYDVRYPGRDYPNNHNILPASIMGIPGHYVENVLLENIDITYPGRGDEGSGYLPLWRLKDVRENEHGYPEYDLFGELPAWGFYVRHAKGVTFKNVTVRAENRDYRPAYVFDDVEGVTMDGIIRIEEDDCGQQIILRKNVTGIDLKVEPKLVKTVE
jgi:polygalacturonase